MKVCTALLVICSILMLAVVAAAQPRTDAQILAELQRRIQPRTGISIQVQNGIVTLTGTVPSLAQKQSIIGIARRTIGVRDVIDKITVVPLQKRTDAQIEQSVRRALFGNLSKEELAAISVHSANGVVTLTGTLTGSYPKQLAGVLSSWVRGVVEVKNDITVKPSQIRGDLDILADIKAQFAHDPFIPQSGITVSVENGLVTLTGIVDSFLQASRAENVARFTPGVVDVHNLLFVR